MSCLSYQFHCQFEANPAFLWQASGKIVESPHHCCIRGDESRKTSVRVERVNVQVVQKIYEARKEAGLSQKALPDLVITIQSVISGLEDADHEGHSLSMLSRIADALRREIVFHMPAKDSFERTSLMADQHTLRKDKRMATEVEKEKACENEKKFEVKIQGFIARIRREIPRISLHTGRVPRWGGKSITLSRNPRAIPTLGKTCKL